MYVITNYILVLCIYLLLAVLMPIYGEHVDMAMTLSVDFDAALQIPYFEFHISHSSYICRSERKLLVRLWQTL